ncbi:MAG TPA: PDDEXK nuclease domain-containing protein [Pirellulales bacterium]|nr:PDDEXK nuclease domain-containing protein [Pirellulales bacterium]
MSLPFIAGIGGCLSSPQAGVAPRWGARCRSPISQGSAALHPGLSNHAASRLHQSVTNNPTDSPTIGLILCQGRNRVVAEYALRGMTQPIGISEYELTR